MMEASAARKDMLVIALVLLLCLSSAPLCRGFEFAKDGGIAPLQFAQQAVNKNENEASLLAVKFRTGTILLSVCKQKKAKSVLGTRSLKDDTVHENRHLRALFVGEKSDCQQARLLCAELDRTHHTDSGAPITASMLTLSLADRAQQSSMGEGRVPAYNALVVNIDQKSRSNFGEIFKVDVSGNFFRCGSVCIGARSEQMRSWMGSRGQLLHSQLQNDWAVRDACGGTPTSRGRVADSAVSVLDGLFNISTSCLLENYPVDELAAGNYSIFATVLQQRERGERSVVGPYQVPVEVLQRLSPHKNRNSPVTGNAENVSSGLETGDEAQRDVKAALVEWWKTMGGIAFGEEMSSEVLKESESAPVWVRRS